MRQTRYKKRSHKKIWLIVIALIVLILVGGIIFFFPLNNTIRNMSGGNDTLSDKAIKNELVQKIESSENGDPSHDKKILKAANSLKNTKMSSIMKAAGDQNKAAQELHDNTSLSKDESKKVAKKVFSDSNYDQLRKSVSNGNWYSAFKQYKRLSNDGSLTELKNSINE